MSLRTSKQSFRMHNHALDLASMLGTTSLLIISNAPRVIRVRPSDARISISDMRRPESVPFTWHVAVCAKKRTISFLLSLFVFIYFFGMAWCFFCVLPAATLLEAGARWEVRPSDQTDKHTCACMCRPPSTSCTHGARVTKCAEQIY